MSRLTILLILTAISMAGYAKDATMDSLAASHSRLIAYIIDYLSSTNQPDTTRKFNISFIGGPYYSTEKKLGIGIVAAGLYRNKSSHNASCQVNIYTDVSATGFYKIGVDGIHCFGKASHRLIYDVSFESMPDRYWGMGYDANRDNYNETDYDRRHAMIDCSLLFRMPIENLYAGPHIMSAYIAGNNITDATLWNGQRLHTFTNSIGIDIEYDTRDNRYNAHRGIYIGVSQMTSPRFLGNKYAFSSTELSLNTYAGIWNGCTFAFRLHSRMSYGNTPWSMMSKVGGSYSMRGYWEGRYNDKCAADATLELRQKIYRRHGAVLWAGVGEVFRHPRNMFEGHALPNAGVGYRWEFKKDVNIRLDCGFGSHGCGIIFNLNEAF